MKRVLAALFTNLPAETIPALTDTIPMERKKSPLTARFRKPPDYLPRAETLSRDRSAIQGLKIKGFFSVPQELYQAKPGTAGGFVNRTVSHEWRTVTENCPADSRQSGGLVNSAVNNVDTKTLGSKMLSKHFSDGQGYLHVSSV